MEDPSQIRISLLEDKIAAMAKQLQETEARLIDVQKNLVTSIQAKFNSYDQLLLNHL